MAGGDASTGAEVDAGFEFAFDNEIFSDKVLRIEVGGGGRDAPGSGAGAASRKRRREGPEGEGTPILLVKTIRISSVILAAQSSFFYKLFSNGMKESRQREATVRIADSELRAFMELLRFMYSGKLTPTMEPTLVLDILMAADKFDVVSCIKLCCQRLIDLPMTLESAMRCLDLPCPILVTDLKGAAMKFFAESGRYKEFPQFQDELMRIPLLGILAILTRKDLKVASEVAAYDFVIRWACSWYPNSQKRRRILSSCLLPIISARMAKHLIHDCLQSMNIKGIVHDCLQSMNIKGIVHD